MAIRKTHRPWQAVSFGDTARTALDLAAKETGSNAMLETGRVLLALARVDVRGDWSRFWLHTGYAPMRLLVDARDSGPAQPVATWTDKPMSAEMEACLTLVAHWSEQYELAPVPPGALALGLLADPQAGAARTILAVSELSHESLLELVEDELLGARLVEARPEVPRPAPRPSTSTVAVDWRSRTATIAGKRSPDDLDLLKALVQAAEIDEQSNGSLIAEAMAEVGDQARELGTRTLDDVIDSARAEFDVGEPGAQHLLFAAADRPSVALTRILRVAAMSPRLIAAGAAERLEQSGARGQGGGRSMYSLSVLNIILIIAVLVLIVRHAAQTGNWWELVFLVGAAFGPPSTSVWLSVVASAATALVNPLAAGVMAAEAGLSWMRDRSERRALTARTGVRLSPAEYRAFMQHRRYTAGSRRRWETSLFPLRAARLLNLAEQRAAGQRVAA